MSINDGCMEMTLNSPITEEQWDAITDVDFEHTNRIWFHTKHGKDVEFAKVVHGHWDVHEDTYGDDEAKCSVCGFEMAVNQPGNGLCMVSELNYCPHCGAQMDESTQSNDSNTLDALDALGEKVTE